MRNNNYNINILVEKNEKTEPIWKNGEMSVIKTAIMAVVLENKGRREYQTLPNAYYFVAEMFKERNGKMPIDEYMAKKEANDPIKKFFAIADKISDFIIAIQETYLTPIRKD